ncbi:carboxyl transferase domain-containing protein [Rhodococcoides corynebacterioides]|uniref:Acetyl-CoA carboxyl transferase n=1 Tax=Rhodococcoides corynebacterioides TaxID=53972 RepID=A0ABS7NZ57_9NOCA|nr:carboxyl transferase domain-containing protein [Rhodococcus corynebacterioides]MBY6365418.1 acetyl-CoA carboxyl transferase [Rhodococcus corynebacterioides]MBY6407928.1 acetyl-CoA carboxyl transferase [Rhodococcus corynebacterioides]
MTVSARALIDLVVDPGTYVSLDEPPTYGPVSDAYRADLARARERSGVDESVLTGDATVGGTPVTLIVGEFSFLAGSIGHAAAERITAAIEHATAAGRPLIASPSSGGTRMQEGTVAFVRMITVTAAVTEHRRAGLPYLVYLRHPTTGGVFASWGSLGHLTFAEPGALVGFLGPRVYEALYGAPFPEGVQTAENLARTGVLDAVIEPAVLRDTLQRVLAVTTPAAPAPAPPPPGHAAEPAAAGSAWQSVVESRRPDRPGVRDLLAVAADDVTLLSGTGQGDVDRTVVSALARFRGHPCVVFGQDRAGQTPEHTMGPGALREARRAMRLAEELRLPLVTVIDTLGASLSREAEERGLAPEIARCIADLVTLRTPTVSVLLGQGTGGGALALLPADRTVAAAHAWLAPLPPEGASAIVHRDTAHAAELAEAQGIRATDLRASGVVDTVVDEGTDGGTDERVDESTAAGTFLTRMGDAVARELAAITELDDDARAAARRRRFRHLGVRFAPDGA